MTTKAELPTGFYNLPRVDSLNAVLEKAGYEANVVCVSLEAGLDFRRRDTSTPGVQRQRRAYHTLCQTLRCVDQLSGTLSIVVPGFVSDPRSIPAERLVQQAQAIGFMNDHTNANPACLGMVMVTGHLRNIAMGQPISDAPGKYYVYADVSHREPFILTGTCLDVWHRLPHGLQTKQIELIRTKVQDAGLTFSVKKLWAFISPGGRNDGYGISQAGYDRLKAAGPEYAYYLYEGGGRTQDKPHGLDLAGLSYRQAVLAGIPEGQIGGLHGESTLMRTPTGQQKWGIEHGQGGKFASGIIAGIVRRKGV